MFGNGSIVLKQHGVNLVLNYYCGPTVNAARGLANQIEQAIQQFSGNFMMAINPQITQSYAKGDYDYTTQLVNKGARFSFYIMWIISLPVIINAEFILGVWLKDVPAYTVIFLQLTLINTLVEVIKKPLVIAQNATGVVRNCQISIGLIGLLNVPLCFIIMWLGAHPYDVVLISIVISIVSIFVWLYFLKITIHRFKPKDFIANVILKISIVTTCSSIFPVLVKQYVGEGWPSFVFSSLTAFMCCVIIIWFSMENNERMFVLSFVKKRLRNLTNYAKNNFDKHSI